MAQAFQRQTCDSNTLSGFDIAFSPLRARYHVLLNQQRAPLCTALRILGDLGSRATFPSVQLPTSVVPFVLVLATLQLWAARMRRSRASSDRILLVTLCGLYRALCGLLLGDATLNHDRTASQIAETKLPPPYIITKEQRPGLISEARLVSYVFLRILLPAARRCIAYSRRLRCPSHRDLMDNPQPPDSKQRLSPP